MHTNIHTSFVSHHQSSRPDYLPLLLIPDLQLFNNNSLHLVLSLVCSSLTSITGRLGSGFSGGGYGGGAQNSEAPALLGSGIDAVDILFCPAAWSSSARRCSEMPCMLLMPTLSRRALRTDPSE